MEVVDDARQAHQKELAEKRERERRKREKKEKQEREERMTADILTSIVNDAVDEQVLEIASKELK